MAVNLPKRIKVNRGRGQSPSRLLPGLCHLCGNSVNRIPGLCDQCRAGLQAVNRFCPGCAMPMHTTGLCGTCLNRGNIQWSYIFAAYEYAYPVNRLVHLMKFQGRPDIAETLASLIAEPIKQQANESGWPDVIVPVPLHRQRTFRRGFNQSLEIARVLGRQLRLPVLPGACRRILNTPEQSRLGGGARRTNLGRAFACDGDMCAGKTVAIVDDVITTGTTVRELSRQLLSAGAGQIMVWCVAVQRLLLK